MLEHFRTQSLEGFGCEHMPRAIRAGGGLLRYVQDTQKAGLTHVNKIQAFQEDRILPIDPATRRALELTSTQRDGERKGSLLASFDRTSTAPGGRKLREWLLEPLTRVDEIVCRQEGIAELVEEELLRDQAIALLRRVHDVERICTRISYGNANARDLISLARTLEVIPELS